MKVIRFYAHPALEILGVETLALALVGAVNLLWKDGGLLSGYVAAAPVVFSWSAAMVMTQFSEVYARLALGFGATRRQITAALVFWWLVTAGLATLQTGLFRPLIAALDLSERGDFISAIYGTPVFSWFWLTLLVSGVLMLSVFLPPRGWGLAGRVLLNCLVLLGGLMLPIANHILGWPLQAGVLCGVLGGVFLLMVLLKLQWLDAE